MSKVPKVNVSGPLVPFVAGFHEELERQGYTPPSSDWDLIHSLTMPTFAARMCQSKRAGIMPVTQSVHNGTRSACAP